MTPEEIRAVLLGGFCERLRVTQLKDGAFSIATPFAFPDGDGYPVVLEELAGGRWQFTDRGSACGHLFFDGVEMTEYRLGFIRRTAENGDLRLTERYELKSETFDTLPEPDDLADFLQGVARIGSVVALERQTGEGYVASLRGRVGEWFGDRSIATWYPQEDRSQLYPADARVAPEPGAEVDPVVLFFVGHPGKASRSALSLKTYAEWHLPISPVVTWRSGSLGSKEVSRLQDSHDRVEVVRLDPDTHGDRMMRRLFADRGVPVPAA